jgi:hypothetical protein
LKDEFGGSGEGKATLPARVKFDRELSSSDRPRPQIREVKYKDTDGCHSECLRSEPSISGWTRRSQDFHM